MQLSRLTGLFRHVVPNVAIDLGTVNTFIAVRGRGVVLREPSAIAVSVQNEREILAVGRDALAMLGRTPGGIRVLYPMRDGVVADHTLCEAMLKFYLQQTLGRRAIAGVRLMLCLPMCVTGVEKRALQEAAHGVGASEVQLMEEPLAAAIGAQLPVREAVGSMVVDIGGGTTDAAVVALGGMAAARSIRTGGTHIDAAIMEYVDKAYGVMIGSRTAEEVKRTIGSATLEDSERMEVRGRNRESGLPVSLTLGAGEIGHAILPTLRLIMDAVRQTLGDTPPELAGDLTLQGVTLCGGGAHLRGLDHMLAREVGLPVRVAPNPMACVVMGALCAMDGVEPELFAGDYGTVEMG